MMSGYDFLICSEVSVNSPANPWSQSGRGTGRLRWEEFAEKEVFKSEMIEWGVADDESGESMEPIEEMPLVGESEMVRLVRG